jgi:peptide/nickel transport system permease protein
MRKPQRFGLILAFLWLGILGIGTLGSFFLGDPLQLNLAERFLSPSVMHWFGTDELGRDLLVRLCHAARFTMLVTSGATVLSLLLGFLMGSIAGWYGGTLDAIIVAMINLFWSIPFVIFVILLITVIGVSPLSLILAIGLINWVTSARIFRTEILRLRRSDFLIFARALGLGPVDIFVHHVLPNLKAIGSSLLGYSMAETIALESGLAFLGLSVPPPLPTWGGMMSDGLQYLSSAWWLAGIPAMTITITLASFRSLSNYYSREVNEIGSQNEYRVL